MKTALKPPHYDVVSDEAGFRRLDPVPSEAEITEFYDRQYYSLVQAGKRGPDVARLMRGGDDAAVQQRWQVATLYRDVLDTLEAYAPGDRVLEVGCGTGDLLLHLGEHHWQTRGVEISPTAADHARDRGLAIYTGSFEDYADGDESAEVDAVLLMNVLEQTRDPRRVLAAARRVLAPGGVICIRSGNEFNPLQLAATEALDKAAWWVSTPDQINYFSFQSLTRLLDESGFRQRDAFADFPMEMFLLMGDDYVADPAVGRACHERRVRFEMSLSTDVRRTLYRALATAGMGRCAFVIATRET